VRDSDERSLCQGTPHPITVHHRASPASNSKFGFMPRPGKNQDKKPPMNTDAHRSKLMNTARRWILARSAEVLGPMRSL